MKKILIPLLLAMLCITSCGKKNDTATEGAEQTTAVSENQTEEVTANYTVDFEEFSKDESIAAASEDIYNYCMSLQPSSDSESMKAELELMSSYIKAVRNLKLDSSQDFKDILLAMGGDAAIEKMLKNDIPENYINFLIVYQSCAQTITEYMRDNNLLIDGKEKFMSEYWRAKHVLIKTEKMTDDEKQEARAKAEDILKQAQNGADFDALVTEYSEDPGSSINPDGYVFTTGSMVQEFEDGTKNTQIGGFTLVESSFGYHVIQRLPLDETPELYERFYQQSGIEVTLNEDVIEQFVLQNA